MIIILIILIAIVISIIEGMNFFLALMWPVVGLFLFCVFFFFFGKK